MATVGMILLAPTLNEMGTIVAICTTGTSAASSIAFASVAPQRVHVPQVEVRMTACTPASRKRWPISWPNFLALATAVPLPTVE